MVFSAAGHGSGLFSMCEKKVHTTWQCELKVKISFDPTIPLLVCYPIESGYLGKKKINTCKDVLAFCSNKSKELAFPKYPTTGHQETL